MNQVRPYLVVVETHPIQYKAPLFRYLTEHADFYLKVLYAMKPDPVAQGAGFGVSFEWDQPLLDGYEYEFLENIAAHPSVVTFGGCDTPGLYDVLRRESPDAVLVNGWVVKTCLQALWASKRLSIPCMVRGEANLLRERARWKAWLQRVLLRQYEAYLYIGTANREFYRARGCNDRALFQAPYAVNHEWFAAEAERRIGLREEVRKSFNVVHTEWVALFAGKLEHKKRPLDLLSAVARMTETLRRSGTVLYAGDGSMRDEIEKRADACGVNVVISGFLNQSQMPDAYLASDFLVLPSDAGETWGLVVNEAMASGRPVVVSQESGCSRDLVQPGMTGFNFKAGDIETLTKHLTTLAVDPRLRAQMGAAASDWVRARGFASIQRGLQEALDYLTGKHR